MLALWLFLASAVDAALMAFIRREALFTRSRVTLSASALCTQIAVALAVFAAAAVLDSGVLWSPRVLWWLTTAVDIVVMLFGLLGWEACPV